jgi:hypothetical protein
MWIKESFSSLSRKLFLSTKVIENSNANFYIQTTMKNRRLISHHMWSTVSWRWWIQVFKPVATHTHTWRKSTLLLVWLLTGGHISLDLRKTTTCEYRYVALEFRSITCGSRSAPLALSQWRRPLTIRHHSEFLFVWTTTSFPQTAPIVDTNFCPVTWHHQRRPFARVLACKTVKTRRGWPAEPPLTVKSVKCLKKGERERKRESWKKKSVSNRFLYPLLYPCMLYVHFAPIKHNAPCRRLISSLTSLDLV